MFCSISGEVPEHPVISIKSGHIYEQRLIHKYISEHGTCPISGFPLSVSDLVAINTKQAARPRLPSATSIPNLLALFQSEWDSLLLETIGLKKQLESVRTELSQSLYQYDAACRMIARLVKERDSTRGAVNNVGGISHEAQDSTQMEQSQQVLSPQVVSHMNETASHLASRRKKRHLASDQAAIEDIKNFRLLKELPQGGGSVLDIHPSTKHVLLGKKDQSLFIYGENSELLSKKLDSHESKIFKVAFHPSSSAVFSCSADNTFASWKIDCNSEIILNHRFRVHNNEVTALSLHASGEYLATASVDCTWALSNINTNSTLLRVSHPQVTKGYSCLQIHPDGLIMGTGGEHSKLRIWDLKTSENVITFNLAEKIYDLRFSENGYHMAAADNDGTVTMFDLRKIEAFQTLKLPYNATSLDFDYSGQFLAVGGESLRLYSTRSWECLNELALPSIHSLRFSHNARFIAIGAEEGTYLVGV